MKVKPIKVKFPNKEVDMLIKQLQFALEEVARLERGEIKSTNARDFLNEL